MISEEQRERWSELWTLFGAYLNQDFPDDYGSPEATVLAYQEETPKDHLALAADQAEDLARSVDDEEELRQTMLDLGLEYAPWADGWEDSHAWLRHLAERFRG